MKNEGLIQNFETDALPGNGFHHADHVRLAFAYLCEYPPLEALAKFSAALKRFAMLAGTTDLSAFENDRNRTWSHFQLAGPSLFIRLLGSNPLQI
jgi:hypothetical protein